MSANAPQPINIFGIGMAKRSKAIKQERDLNKIERSDMWHSAGYETEAALHRQEVKPHKKHHAKKPKKAHVKKDKMEKVMHEYKEGKLHSGSKKGPKVTSRKQAVAIGLSEARKAGMKVKPKKKK